jgi:hypothetical protein
MRKQKIDKAKDIEAIQKNLKLAKRAIRKTAKSLSTQHRTFQLLSIAHREDI